jgi:hypothetical protein
MPLPVYYAKLVPDLVYRRQVLKQKTLRNRHTNRKVVIATTNAKGNVPTVLPTQMHTHFRT